MDTSTIEIKIVVKPQHKCSTYKCAGCVFVDVEDCGSVRYALDLPDCAPSSGDLVFVKE